MPQALRYAKRMFEKFWANIIRYYTNKVRLRGLTQNQGFQPTKVGFACVAKPLLWGDSAVGGFPDLFAQRLPLGEATVVGFPDL
ncbi:MAG: hypothetical protein KME23_01545 [Goleter apudmare HA4340-LM2]|nr:hypothetical protein [Goleter apudmare HA4340-LM2]